MTDRVFASVLITTRNRQSLVLNAVRSALKSRLQDLEVVVVDDCSEDDTPAQIANVKDSRLKFYRLALRRGRVGARNFGASLALGEVLVFLDDDDLFLDGGLDALVDAIRKLPDEIVAVYAVPRYVSGNSSDGYFLVDKPLPGLGLDGSVVLPLLMQNFIQPGAVVVRKAAFVDAGGFTGEVEPIALEDWRLWLQLAARGRFAYLDQEVVQILRHEGNTPEQLFTQSKCEYFGSAEFGILLERVWAGLSDEERRTVCQLLLRYAASSQVREQFALARKLVRRAQRCGAVFPYFGPHQLWRSWIPRFWKR